MPQKQTQVRRKKRVISATNSNFFLCTIELIELDILLIDFGFNTDRS